MNEMITIKKLTKDFKQNRGIFDIDLHIKEGEVFGLIGINGSGKSTIMRNLMGFLKPDKGNARMMGKDCWKRADELKHHVGYIPGEISFPEVHSGMDFLNLQADYQGIKSMAYAKELMECLNLDASAKLKRMSKGMKQKTAIVNAFMGNPSILLLDEATTGLDPLMQKAFTDIVKKEKKKGKTIFMSSHMFDEMESTCDRVAFLKNGKIIYIVDMQTIHGNENQKEYKIEFHTKADYLEFGAKPFKITRMQNEYNQVTISIPDEEVDRLFAVLSKMDVRFISHQPYTLEACFKEIYNNTEAV